MIELFISTFMKTIAITSGVFLALMGIVSIVTWWEDWKFGKGNND